MLRVFITHKHGTIENYGTTKSLKNKKGRLDVHCGLQIVEFFAYERHLSNQGFNLKLDLKPHHVTK